MDDLIISPQQTTIKLKSLAADVVPPEKLPFLLKVESGRLYSSGLKVSALKHTKSARSDAVEEMSVTHLTLTLSATSPVNLIHVSSVTPSY